MSESTAAREIESPRSTSTKRRRLLCAMAAVLAMMVPEAAARADVVLDVPYDPQNDLSTDKGSCGSASTGMGLAYLGGKNGADDIERWLYARLPYAPGEDSIVPVANQYCSDHGLPSPCAKHYYWSSDPWGHLVSEIDAGRPFVANVHQYGYDHYLLVTGYGNGQVYLNDPVPSRRGWRSWSLFSSQWGVKGYDGIQFLLDAPGKARDVVMVGLSGRGGYVLDGYGKLTPFGGAPAISGGPSWNWDIARRVVFRKDYASGYILEGWGGIHPFGGAPAVSGGPYWQGWDIARAMVLRSDETSGYVLDGYGGIHAFGGAPPIATPAYWSGWDIARDLVLRPDGKSGYLLDGYGGIHAFGGAPEIMDRPYWAGNDVARRLVPSFDGDPGYVLDAQGGVHALGRALPVSKQPHWDHDAAVSMALARDAVSGVVVERSGAVHPFDTAPVGRAIGLRTDGKSGYVLDGYGGLHPFGGAPAAGNGPSWNNWDIARAVALRADGTSGLVLDGWGGLHGFGGAPDVSGGPYWKDWDIARAFVLRTDGKSGYLLDGYGGVHGFGGVADAEKTAYWSGWDIARDLALRSDGASGYVLDGWGGLHSFGGAPAVSGGPYWNGWDIARAVALRTDGVSGYVLDGFGGVHPFGGAPPVMASGYWERWDVARDVVLHSDGSGYVVDVYQGLHPFTPRTLRSDGAHDAGPSSGNETGPASSDGGMSAGGLDQVSTTFGPSEAGSWGSCGCEVGARGRRTEPSLLLLLGAMLLGLRRTIR